jgi:hypothetical protein
MRSPVEINSEMVFFILSRERLRLISAECLCHIEQRLFLNAIATNVELMETWSSPGFRKAL